MKKLFLFISFNILISITYAYSPTINYYVELELDMQGSKLANQQIFYSVKDTDSNDYILHNSVDNNSDNPNVFNIIIPVERFTFANVDEIQYGKNHHYKIYVYGINYNGTSSTSGYTMAIPIRVDVSGISVNTFSDGSVADLHCPTYSYNTHVKGTFAVKFMGQLAQSYTLLDSSDDTINAGGAHAQWGPCHLDTNTSPTQSVTFKSKLDLNYSIGNLINPQAITPFYKSWSIDTNVWK